MIIFVYGADSFSAKEKIKELKSSFLQKSGSTHVAITDIFSSDFDLVDFRNKVLSAGFFTEKKMITIRDLLSIKDINKDAIIEILKKVGNDTIIIFWESNEPRKNCKLYKFLETQKYVYKFSSLSGVSLQNWIRNRARHYDCEIDTRSILYIIEVLGSDLWKIDLELNKLCLHAGEFKKVTVVIARELLAKSAEDNIFKFLDALAVKNKKLALQFLKNEIDAGSHELMILGSIARQIRILIQTKNLLEGGLIDKALLAKELNIHPFVAQKSLSQINNFHINELKNIYRRLLAIDISIKTSGVGARVLFDRMISKL